MSDAEQDAAIVRLVKDRGATKQRKVLLESELHAAGRSLWEIGGLLRNVQGVGAFNETPAAILPAIDKAPDVCDFGRIRLMLEELKAVEETLSHLNRAANTLGID